MLKSKWYVFTFRDAAGKFYASAHRLTNGNNLVDYAKKAVTMNACDSKKDAERIAAEWNKSYIKNGTANKWIMPRAEDVS